MSGNPENALLKGVSRSFYITLRLLPAAMREAASLAYLLARASDTIADTEVAPLGLRMECLDSVERALMADGDVSSWLPQLSEVLTDANERLLLERTGELLKWLRRIPAGEAELVREVVGTIIGGQKLDLDRFARADGNDPRALEDDAMLEDYTWRVAGCVGAFWTKLGFLSMGEGFSTASESGLCVQGISYGKGLQLVNILRDLPEDLAAGRCYLPVLAPGDTASLLRAHARWVERAFEWIGAGFTYSEALNSRRLRVATVLPAMIARETLERLRGADLATLQARVKVPRSRVYLSVLRAFAGFPG